MNEFIAIETANRGLFLEVDLGSVCNYKCSYCPPHNYTGKTWLDCERLIKFIRKVNPLQVTLVGGEPTLYPMIDPLLLELENRVVNVTSNGSRSLSWWKSYTKYFDVLTLSYHIEYANLESFIDKLKFMTDHRSVTVNVSMILERFDECLAIGMELAKIKNTNVSLKALTDIEADGMYEYSDEQLEIMSDLLRSKDKYIINNHHIRFYGKRENGQVEELRAQTIKSNKTNMYRGWKCWKGIQLIKLGSDGKIHKAICDIGGNYIGSIYDDDFTLPTEPEICKKNYCHCLTDLKSIKKEKI